MKPVVGYYPRRSSKSKVTKKIPICISVRFNGTTLSYVTGLELKNEEYEASQKKNPEGQAMVHSIQISTAHKRMKAIAELMEPYLPEAFAYIVKEARKDCEDIFIDVESEFDAYKIASKYLEDYKKMNPEAQVPVLLGADKASNQEVILAPYNTYAEKVQANFLPSNYQKLGTVPSKPELTTDGKVTIVEDMGIPSGNGSAQQVFIHNTFIVNGNGGGNGQLMLPDSEYNPDGNLLTFMMENMDETNAEKTDDSYGSGLKLLIRFFKKIGKLKYLDEKEDKPYIPFRSVLPQDLLAMEDWMIKEGKYSKKTKKTSPMSPHTVKTYLSFVKSAYGKAEKRRIIKYEDNPFGEGKFRMPDPGELDRSLKDEQVKKLLEYTPVPPKRISSLRVGKDGKVPIPFSQEKARDFWLFSYLGSGMNIIDVAKLEKHKIAEEEFGFRRSKTEKRRRYQDIKVKISPELRYLMLKYGLNDKDPSPYVFPIITEPVPSKPIEEMTFEEEKAWKKRRRALITRQVDSFTAKINRHMRAIAENLGFNPKNFTTYSARHTFSNDALQHMKDFMVAKMLGHSSTGTLKKYNNREDLQAQEDVQKAITKHIPSKNKIKKSA